MEMAIARLSKVNTKRTAIIAIYIMEKLSASRPDAGTHRAGDKHHKS
jgi:hypothetical protein